ncbi:MAG TPA: type VI secretion system tube protein Hcp [Patescibacteria group bacterium]|nr:type VI secretion system tube protein Hcp [Patescibacteria group bacterium]
MTSIYKKILAAGLIVVTAFAFNWNPQTLSLSVPEADAAAVDYYLKIEGIEGESTDSRHKGEIEIESFSWGATQPGISRPGSAGGGGGAGKVNFQDLHFTAKASKASPKLMLAAATGEHIKKAVLFVRKSGQQQDFYKIELQEVLVSSYQTGGSSGQVPTESFSLNFTKIEFEYRAQKADGSLDAPVKAGYDVKANKKI